MGKEHDTGFRPSRALKHRMVAMNVTPEQQKLFFEAEKLYQKQKDAARAPRGSKTDDEPSD